MKLLNNATKTGKMGKWMLSKVLTNFKFSNKTEFWGFMEDFRSLVLEYLETDEDVKIFEEFMSKTEETVVNKVQFHSS